jgi:hypothetical protein
MSFQKQVHSATRTLSEIDAENQGTFVVHPCATRTSIECFPCIAIEVFRPDQKPQKTCVDLRELGKHFDTLDAAMEVARKVRVVSVDDAGEVRWVVMPE